MPLFTGGNEIFVNRYTVSIASIDYYMEENCTEMECTHVITTNGTDLLFNTNYIVEVTSFNTCGEESSAQIFEVSIGASSEFYILQ